MRNITTALSGAVALNPLASDCHPREANIGESSHTSAGTGSLSQYSRAPAVLRSQLSLDGSWQFALDPHRVGLKEGWFAPERSLDAMISVPGCWQAQGFGKPRLYLRHDYLGWAWYKRQLHLDDAWRGRQVWIKFSGVSRSARIFVNEKEAGLHNGFSAPFRMDITSLIQAGATNTIALLVDNTAGSSVEKPLTEHDYSRPTGAFNYMGNWGGIYGHAALEATSKVWLDEVHARTTVAPPHATFSLRLAAAKDFPGGSVLVRIKASLRGQASSYSSEGSAKISSGKAVALQIDLPMPNAQLWSPEDPALYVASIQVLDREKILDSLEQPFGVREISTRNGRILLNGRPYYLVGFGDLASEVLTGTPDVSLDENRRRVKMAKAYGFNFVRCHSRIPPEEFFQAADELGLLVHAELPVFYSPWLLPFLDFAWSEQEEAFKAFRNHPSFVSSALGNELRPLPGKEGEFQAAFEKFYQRAKELNPDALAMSTDGWTVPPADVYSIHRGYQPGKPTICHEFGGWLCSLPDTSLEERFTGVVDPYWMKNTQRWVKENGLEAIYPSLVKGSQRLMLGEMRKFYVERVRRMPQLEGYELWLINDYASGTAEGYLWAEGTLDFFWEPKALTAEEFRSFNALNVLLTDSDFSQRCWWQGSTVPLKFFVSYYGANDLANATLTYSLQSHGQVLHSRNIREIKVPQGNVSKLAEVEIGVPILDNAAQLTLEAKLLDGKKIIAQNQWAYWSYPRQLLQTSRINLISRLADARVQGLYPFIEDSGEAEPDDLLLMSILEPSDLCAILNGAKAIIFLQRNRTDGQVPFGYFPVFNGKPHCYGSRVEEHPIFRALPGQGDFDPQFYNLLEGSFGLERTAFSPLNEISPLLWCVWSSGDAPPALHRIGFLYEFQAGKGKVIVTTLNFLEHLDNGYPSVVFLFDAILRYAASAEFRPTSTLTEESLSFLMRGIRV
ncbi:MAG TPA: hypothetical protein VFD30_02470 [Terriglobia bacterium]|nr:hypothetical protein [Terriglobia bacterium]